MKDLGRFGACRIIAGVDPSHPPNIEEEERFVPSNLWAEMVRKLYEVDPLVCPFCGGKMLVSVFSEDPKIKSLPVL